MRNKRIDLRASEKNESDLKIAGATLGESKVSDIIFKSVETVANLKPELYFINRQAIREIQQSANFIMIWVQKFMDEFKRLTGENLSLTELEAIFQGAGKLDSTKIIQNAITEQVRRKLYDRLKRKHTDMTISWDNVPVVDMTALFEIADKIDSMPPVQMRQHIYWHIYSTTGNQISIIPEKLERLFDSYRFYATTPEEISKLQLIKKICEGLNELLKDPDARPNIERIFSVVYFDRESWQFVPSGSFVKFPLTIQPSFDLPTTTIQ